MSTRHRAEPLAPEDRKKAIVEAVIPLLLTQGPNTTTAQMADAAGIAEGTIFRVFPDKGALVHEAIRSCLDPAPTLEQMSGIEPDLPFEIKLRKAAAIILQRSEKVHALAAVLRSLPAAGESHHQDTHKAVLDANTLIFSALTRVFQDDAGRLAVEPARAAAAFRGLLFAVSFPLIEPDEQITADEAIDVLLKGIVKRVSA